MSIGTRRPRAYVPRDTLFLPSIGNAFCLGRVSNATSALTANRAYYNAFSPPYDTAVATVSVYCVAGTTQNFDMALYDAAGTRLGSLGSTGIASTTGIKTWTPSTPIGVQAGTIYYAAFGTDSATPTWTTWGASVFRGSQFGTLIQATAFALPASWTTPTIAAGVVLPLLRITFSG